jgi:hypothetical protein
MAGSRFIQDVYNSFIGFLHRPGTIWATWKYIVVEFRTGKVVNEMSKGKLILVFGGVLVALLLASVIGVSAVSAQEPGLDPGPPIPFGRGGLGHGLLGRIDDGLWTAFDAGAEALGLEPSELFSELHEGNKLAEIAEEQGVELDDVREAIGAARGTERSPWSTFDTVAEALGLTPEELFSELHEGKTLAEIAEERGVELEEVREAVSADRVEAQKEAIEQAVEDGRLSQEQADWMIEGLEKGFFPGGGGLGRFHGGGAGRPSLPRGRGRGFGF